MKLIITGGRYKGRYIVVSKQKDLRPVMTMIREVFFNIIDVKGMDFLDLFAGTGIMGIEAISRGATGSFFVEKNHILIKKLKENLIKLGIDEKLWKIFKKDLRKPSDITFYGDSDINKKFDIVYTDPPFVFKIGIKLKNWIIRHTKEEGIVVLRRYKKEKEEFEDMELIDERIYGDNKLYIYRKS